MLGEEAFKRYDKKDYGPRGRAPEPRLHTFCAAMCWAACDRLHHIATKLAFSDRALYWRGIANKIATFIKINCWNAELNSYVSYVDGTEVDAFLLRMEEVRMMFLLFFLGPTEIVGIRWVLLKEPILVFLAL